MSSDVDRIIDLLKNIAGYENLELDVASDRLRLAGRVDKKVSSQVGWKEVTDRLLDASGKHFVLDLSRVYMRVGQGAARTKKYYWRMIFQAPSISDAIPHITQVIQSTNVNTVRGEIQEVKLYGARNGGKGSSGDQGSVKTMR